MRKKLLLSGISMLLCSVFITTSVALSNDTTNQETYDNPFTDVSESDWYYNDVKYVLKNNLMNGTDTSLFSPYASATRGMIVTILWRLEGEPLQGNTAFSDVTKNDYFCNAVAWASENGIVNGYDGKTFAPNDTATREQLAVIMHRYASYKNYDLAKTAELESFKDATLISDYAVESIKWAVANNIISGTSDTSISPKDFVQRCQISAILKRFCSQYKSKNNASVPTPTANNSSKGNSGGSSHNSGASKPAPTPTAIPEKIPSDTTISVETVSASHGETVSVDLKLQQNPGILGMMLSLEYDERAMKLVDAANGEAVSDVLSLTTSKELKSGTIFLWDGLDVQADQIKDGTFLTLTFEIFDDAVTGNKYPLTLTYDDGNIIDANLNEVELQIEQGYIEIKEGGY